MIKRQVRQPRRTGCASHVSLEFFAIRRFVTGGLVTEEPPNDISRSRHPVEAFDIGCHALTSQSLPS